MLGKFFARLAATMFAPPSERPFRRPGVTARLRLEPLEGRAMPAVNVWTGSAGPDFDTPGSWTLGHVAAAGEDLVFGVAEDNGPGPLGFSSMTSPDGEGGGVGGTGADCYGMHPPAGGGAYNSVTLEAVYVGKVTVTGGFSTGDLNLAGGTLDQPGGADIPYADTDITVTGTVTLDTENHHLLAALPANFTWTNGTLNSTSNLATLTVTGGTTTALFEPTNLGKAVDLGSSITLTGGAVGTMREGTINLLNDGWTFNINANSGLQVNPGPNLGFNVESSFPIIAGEQINIKAGASVRLVSGLWLNKTPLKNDGGTFTVSSGTATFGGQVAGGPAYSYVQTAGATYLAPGSTFALFSGMLMSGGALSIKLNEGSGPAVIQGKLTVMGGDIISSEHDNGDNHRFGELKVLGRVQWGGGTYRPFLSAEFASVSDLWSASSFDIGGTAALAPGAVDGENNPVLPPPGMEWDLLKAVVLVNVNGTPTHDPLWSIVKDPGNPVKWWKVKGA